MAEEMADLQTALNLYKECLREGYLPLGARRPGKSAMQEASSRACRLGLCKHPEGYRSTIKRALLESGEEEGLTHVPIGALWAENELNREPRIVKHGRGKPKGQFATWVWIGDAHDAPGLSKERFVWLNNYIHDKKPDGVGIIGDFLTLDSMSFHAKPGSIEDRDSPTLKEDLDSGNEALSLLLKDVDVPIYMTEGNHEYRAKRFDDAHPRSGGIHHREVRNLFRRHGVKVSDYGDYLELYGVWHTHIPHNTIGKAYGGKTAPTRILNDSLRSVIHGHTHYTQIVSQPKIGGNLKLVSLPSALPWGYREPYMDKSSSDWDYGVTTVTYAENEILSVSSTSMVELERLYS